MSAKARGVVERSLGSFVDGLQHTFEAEEVAKKRGLLQSLDPRIKIFAILPLILIAALAKQLRVIVALFVLAIVLALLSRVPLFTLAKRVSLAVLAFTGVISVPALFLTPGQVIYTLPLLNWTVTAQGLRAAVYLIMRAETSARSGCRLCLSSF
jgi:cobalt/nickel transport system permease protein